MWRSILLIQWYSTVARAVGIPNSNRPLLSGAGYKCNCACWQIVSVYCCLRHTAPAAQRKISTVSMWALQGSHDDVLREVGRQGVVTFPFSKSKFNHFYRTCARDLRATVAIRCIAPCSRKHAANRSNSRTLFRPMWRDRSRDYRKFTNTEFMIFFASYSPALKISTVNKLNSKIQTCKKTFSIIMKKCYGGRSYECQKAKKDCCNHRV